MRYALWTVAVLAALVGVIALVGWLLPVGHVASRTMHVRRSPVAVFERVSDVATYPAWRSGVARVEILEPASGLVRFREYSGNGDGLTMEIVESVVPAKLVTRIADPSQPFGGTWTFEIGAAADGAVIIITERGEVYNPIFRFVARFVLGHHRTLDQYLADLRAAS